MSGTSGGGRRSGRHARIAAVAAVVTVVTVAPTAAQTSDARFATIDSLHDALKPVFEMVELKGMLAADSAGYPALWRAARAEVDIARLIKSEHESSRALRDSVYEVAADYARRAVAADSLGAEGHFTVALALGELSRTRGGKERVRFARSIYDEAARAIALDSLHDGAEHILGAWHAEIMRLSSVQRFFAKTLFGAGFMNRAAWDSAVVHLQRAVAIKPDYLFHRLELAQVYADLERWAEADEQLAVIPGLAPTDVLDGEHRAAAAALRARVAKRLADAGK
jgi:hypothetical protein